MISRGKGEKEEGIDDKEVKEAGNDVLESKAQFSYQKKEVIFQRRNWGDGLNIDVLKIMEDFEHFFRKEDVILGNEVPNGRNMLIVLRLISL